MLDVKRVSEKYIYVQKVLKVLWALENNPILVIRFKILDKDFKTKLSIDLLVFEKLHRKSLFRILSLFVFYHREPRIININNISGCYLILLGYWSFCTQSRSHRLMNIEKVKEIIFIADFLFTKYKLQVLLQCLDYIDVALIVAYAFSLVLSLKIDDRR